MAKKFDDSDGVWRTIDGRKIFIRTGQSLSEAMRESGKFKDAKVSNDKATPQEELSEKERKELEEGHNEVNSQDEKLAKDKKRLEELRNDPEKNAHLIKLYEQSIEGHKETKNTIVEEIKRKAYKKYLKEHPLSEISFEEFKDMRKL